MFYRVLFSRNISRFGSLSSILISGVYFYSSFSAHGVRAQNFGPIKSPMKSSLIEICKSGYISTEQNSNSYISPTLKRRLQGIIPYKIFLKVAHTRVVQDADPRSKSVRVRPRPRTRTRADAQIRDEPGTRTRKNFLIIYM